MKMLSETEKARFQEKGIINDVQKEYYVDIKDRAIISLEDLKAHFGADDQKVEVIISTEAAARKSGVRNFSLSEIAGASKF